MNFRNQFIQYKNVLEKHKNELHRLQFYPTAVFNEIDKTIDNRDTTFGYNSSPVKLVLPRELIPSHTIPKDLNYLEIVLAIKDEIILNKSKESRVEDPIKQLVQFDLILKSDEYSASWHLDRHVKGINDGTCKYLHPIYHWTFGGYHVEQEYNEKGKEFGKSIFMRSPRLMHPSMELILGLDFIFNHFIPSGHLELLSDKVYQLVIKNIRSYIWKPYALAFAKHFCGNLQVDNNKLSFDEIFVQSVVSC